jgi:hypothetical protein
VNAVNSVNSVNARARPVRAGLALGAICVAAALSSEACGSTAGVEPTAPLGEAGTDAPPDLPTMADAAVLDAPPDVADAAIDVVAPGHFCAGLVPAPRFCDDFDDGDLTNNWTSFAAQPGSVLELDTAISRSAPASFHVVAMEDLAAAPNNVLLRTTLLGAVSHGKLSFSTLLPSITFTKGAIAIARFHITLNDSYTLYLRGPDAAGNIATLEENVGGVVTEHMLSSLPPIGVWTRVMLDLDLAGGKASLSFGALKALDAVAITPMAGTEATVRIGAVIDGPSDTFEAHFDDVVVDF